MNLKQRLTLFFVGTTVNAGRIKREFTPDGNERFIIDAEHQKTSRWRQNECDVMQLIEWHERYGQQ